MSWARPRILERHGQRHHRNRRQRHKVAITALTNAGSVAGLLLTTEALIADKPKDDEDHGHGGGRGGMGGMM